MNINYGFKIIFKDKQEIFIEKGFSRHERNTLFNRRKEEERFNEKNGFFVCSNKKISFTNDKDGRVKIIKIIRIDLGKFKENELVRNTYKHTESACEYLERIRNSKQK